MSLFSVQNAPYLLLSVVVFLLSIFVAKRIARLVEASWSAQAAHRATAKFVSRFAQVSTLVLGFGAALSISGIDASILIGASTFAIGYALRNWLANLLSGVIIASSKVIDVGTYITAGEGGGTVLEISGMSTQLKTITNQTIRIPNATLVGEPLSIAAQYPERLVKFDLWLQRDNDPGRATEVLERAIAALPELTQSPEPPMVLLTDFSQGPLVFTVRFWIEKAKLKGSIIKYKPKVMLKLNDALEAAGMEMPYPVTTLSACSHDSGLLGELLAKPALG